ncbi:hypothetical protein L596_014262 [Steinernema carpocapsae]|uniref:Uncharacterized protein n=1 Tax=Steinernema carpocapsae TaxID=34508 RepID=A0A4U5NCI7_STECR|nr:hypothetical protein L596_014262 [Steinernema carpocapsae]
MPFTVSGSFIECFSSIESCTSLCSFGECFYVDMCNDRSDVNYYCSAASPYKAIFIALAVLFILFLCCCGGFSILMWNNYQKRSRLPELNYVLRPLDQQFVQQQYHPRPATTTHY